jgi:orotate phosphoribosyltransferase
VTPSLRHTNRFVRIANVIQDIGSLETLAFWAAEYIAQADAILLDTWSIAAIPLRAMQLIERNQLELDALPGHPNLLPTESRIVVQQLARRMRPEARILFLQSAIGSGSSSTIIGSMFHELASNCEISSVAIYGLGGDNNDIPTLCSLQDNPPTFVLPDECTACTAGSVRVPVDPYSYEIGAAHPPDVALRAADHLPKARAFIERYGGNDGAFRVHRNDPNDGRHHAFYIDVAHLLTDAGFRAALTERLRHIDADLVVIPPHGAGRALAAVAHEVLNKPILEHDDLNSAHLAQEDTQRLAAARQLLILDDTVITGSRLTRYTRSLRESNAELTRITYLVAVARPSSPTALQQLRMGLTKNYRWQATLDAVEELPLPRWFADECPWCAEATVLARVSALLSEPPQWLTERLLALQAWRMGLDAPLLLLPGNEPRAVGDHSPVAPAGTRSTQLVFTLAAGLQALRHDEDEKKRLKLDFPVARYFAERNFSNYNEVLLRACLLRLVRPAEWTDTVRYEPERVVKEYFGDDRFADGELLLAMARRSLLPGLPPDIRADIVARFGIQDSLLSHFLMTGTDTTTST